MGEQLDLLEPLVNALPRQRHRRSVRKVLQLALQHRHERDHREVDAANTQDDAADRA